MYICFHIGQISSSTVYFCHLLMHQVYFMYDSLSASISLVKYFLSSHSCVWTCLICFKKLQIAWIYTVYILYRCMFVICASTCIALNCLFGHWTEIGFCVYCVSFFICVLVIYHICWMLCLVGPWFGNKLYCIVLYSILEMTTQSILNALHLKKNNLKLIAIISIEWAH